MVRAPKAHKRSKSKRQPVQTVKKPETGRPGFSKWQHDLNNHFAAVRMQILLARMRVKKADAGLESIFHEIESVCEKIALLLENKRSGDGRTQHDLTDDRVPVLPSRRSDKKRGLVLLMDDNESLQAALAKILNEVGFEVVVASGGEACANLYRKFHIEGRKVDVVILDVRVPGGLGGFEALERLKQIDPGVRAIVSSGYSGTDVMSNYKQYGFFGALHKPFRVRELIDMIDHLTALPP